MASGQSPIFCDRCMRELSPGAGDFYEVYIEAIADPTPPILDVPEQSGADFTRPLEEVAESMGDLSAREAMDQVHRQVVIHLCQRCYRDWIENPAGS